MPAVRQWLRWTSFWAWLAAGFGAAGALTVSALDAAGIEEGLPALSRALRTERQLDKLAGERGDKRVVLLLGDSLVMDLTPLRLAIPDRLGDLLAARSGGKAHLRAIASPGFGAFTHYFLVDRMLAAEPDRVVLSVNLRWFSPIWRGLDCLEVAGWLPASRWLEALALPASAAGLTLDRLLLSRAVLAAGGLGAWHALHLEQLRVVDAKVAAGRWLQEHSGMPGGLVYRDQLAYAALNERSRNLRATVELAHQTWGAIHAGVPPDSPTLRALDATLAHYREAGVDVLMYVAPLNFEHLRAIGAYDAVAVRRVVRRLAAVARSQGANFLDLHDLLPDAAFGDHNDHLRVGRGKDGAARVAERLLPHVYADASPPERR